MSAIEKLLRKLHAVHAASVFLCPPRTVRSKNEFVKYEYWVETFISIVPDMAVNIRMFAGFLTGIGVSTYAVELHISNTYAPNCNFIGTNNVRAWAAAMCTFSSWRLVAAAAHFTNLQCVFSLRILPARNQICVSYPWKVMCGWRWALSGNPATETAQTMVLLFLNASHFSPLSPTFLRQEEMTINSTHRQKTLVIWMCLLCSFPM